YDAPVSNEVVCADDLDRDGKPDVVVGGGYELGVLYGKGDGTLEPYAQLLTWQAGVHVDAVADFNGDGLPDILFHDGLKKIVVLYNQGGRQFDYPYFQTVGSVSSITVADVNLDRRPDLLCVINDDGGSGAVHVLLNNGNGTFTDHFTAPRIGSVDGVAAG